MTQDKNTAAPLIRLREVSRHYRDGDVLALDQVSLEISDGEFIAVMGKSGSGKSTLLNMLGALDRPTSGEVLFREKLLDESANLDQFRAGEIGFVFQAFYLLPNLTAIENVQIPMLEHERPRTERVSRASELLETVGLLDRRGHLPGQLSSGERQRVAIARALANDPALILADEPTGALDSENGAGVMDLLCLLNREHGKTLVVVTHDQVVADRAERLVRLQDGRIA